MRRFAAPLIVAVLAATPAAGADEVAFPKFKVQEIETGLKVGYAVLIADLNEDKKPDIVVVDTNRVVWYENPTWKRRSIIEGKTKPDNVCITALDIDRDGHLDLVLGADWKPANTKDGGTLQWLRRGKTLDDPWEMFPIGEEPTVHRVRVADIDGLGEPAIILAPLHGRDSSAKGNWVDGRPVRILAYPIPKDPVKGPWVPVVIDESLHVVHNIWTIPNVGAGFHGRFLAASYEGVSLIEPTSERKAERKWSTSRIGEGNQANPKSNRGSSEVKGGRLSNTVTYIATIEPWHGNQVVIYTSPDVNSKGKWDRQVIDEELRWGHAVWCADLDGDGAEELVIGVRDDPNAKAGDKHMLRRGVRIYKATDGKGAKWARHVLDNGGVAVEDLACADLDGDGKIDIIAVGRATGNCKIYWNQGK